VTKGRLCRSLQHCALIVVMMTLAACAPALKQSRLPEDWQTHVEQAVAFDVWQVQGKLGLRSPQQNSSALLSWTQNKKEFVIAISGALGIGKNTLRGNDRRIEWVNDKGEKRIYHDPSEALRVATGLDVPLNALRHWILGVPEPTLEFSNLELDAGTAKQFQQAGWQLEYPRYQRSHGLALPALVRARRDDVTLSIAISRWSEQ